MVKVTNLRKKKYEPSSEYQAMKENIKTNGTQYDIDDSFIQAFYDDSSSFMSDSRTSLEGNGYSNAKSNYNSFIERYRDLNDRKGYITAYMNSIKDSMDEDEYKNAMSYMDSFDSDSDRYYNAFRGQSSFYSRFKTEDDYNRYKIGWLSDNSDDNYTSDKINARRDYLTKQESRIAELDDLIKSASGEEKKNLKAEKEALVADVNQYKRSSQGVRDEYYGYTFKDDFEADSKKRNYNNPTKEDIDEQDSYASGFYDTLGGRGIVEEDEKTGEYILDDGTRVKSPDALDIPDKLGAFLSASEEDIKEAYTRMNAGNGNVISTWDNLMQEGETHRWDLLDENEIAIYYYLYDNQGQEAAYKFLDDMAVDLGRRENEETSKEYDSSNVLKKIAYNVASIPASVFGGVAGFIDDAVNTVQGEEINPYSAAHRLQNFSGIVRSNTAEDINNATNNVSIPGLGFTAGDAYQALMSGADSLFGGKTFGRGFTALMGAGAASQTAQDLYEKGATNTQIAFGSVSAGVAETLFEYVSLDKLLSTTSTKSFGGMVKQVLAQAGVEASEEMATEISNTISEALIMRSQSEWMKLYQEGGFQNAFNETLKNVLSAGLGGAISGGAMAGLSSGANLAMYNNSMKRYGADLYNSGAVDTYKDYANNKDVSADTQKAMHKMEEAVGDSVENSSDGNKLRGKAYRSIGKFADSIDSAMYEDATKAEIRSRLESKEIDVTDKLVNDVYKYITNDADIKFASKETRSIAKEIINDSKSFNGNVSSRMAASRIGMVVDHTTRKSITASSKKASEAVADRVSDTESTVISETGEKVKINKVSSIENGEMILELSDGRKVNSNEVKYASESEALAYESALDLGCSTESANAIVSSLSSVSDESVSRYILGVGEAYRYGLIGQSIDTISKDGFASDLTDKQLKFAYDLGRSDAGTKASQAQEALNAKKGDSKRKGRVLLSTSVSSLTDRQRTSVAAVGRVVSDITHNDVVFYESVVKDGKRVFSKDIAGHKAGESAPNGFYNSGNGAIYIDINAGNMGEGTILFTAAHELTHFIKEWSPEKFKVLSDFLIEEYGKKGVDVGQLVQNQIEKAKKNGRSLSFDDAYEEVIADSMETMFTDTNLAEKLAKLKAKDKTLWEKFKSFFADLFKKIKDAYKGLDPQTQEGMYVKQMMDSIEKISDLFAEALVDAGDTFMKAGSEVGGVSMEYTINDSTEGTDVSDITSKPVQKLQERTEYEKYPKEMIKITSSGAERSAMDITINGKKFSGEASVRELRNARFAENGFKAKDVLNVNKFLDKMRDYMKKARLEYKYIGLQDIYDAKIIISPTTGNIVLSGLVNNGEYEINFDFTKTCKKRLALQDVIEQLAREKGRSNADGTQTEVNLSEENIRHINEVLAANGIETAFLCCFVESKRYAMQSHFQEKVCDVWNRIVDEVNAEEGITEEAPFFNFADQNIETSNIPDGEFDKLYAEMERWRNTKYVDKEGGEGSIERKMKAFLENSPSSRKKLRLSDFVTESGRTNLHKLYPEIESLAKAKIGTALPKAVESFAPYNGEIELMSVSGNVDLATYAKKIAGARSQSFSDFIMSHIYDVLQKTASLTARKMPAHTYTKEISRARLFGMTGEKTNLSVIHDIDPNVDSWNAGLKEDGSYYVSDYDAFRKGQCDQIQAIPDAESIALQNDARYSRDCGRIGVGFSYFHMLKMHNDPDIRQVIGYHSSSLPAAIKPLTHLDKSADYTGVQNTLKFKGFKKPNYSIPEGIPSYATAPQDIEAYNEKGKKISKFSKVTDASFDIKGTYEGLCKNMYSTKAAKETLRQLLQYADDNGLAIETSKAQAGHGDFDLYGDTEATQNPYQTADNYIEYCISRGMIPMFYEFALNDNYYKDIYDFNVFDRLSYNPETGLHEDSVDRKAYAPQTPVHMVNDDGSMAFPDDFWELTDKYMKDFNYQREDFAKKFPKVMEEVRAVKDINGNPMVYSVLKNSDRPEFTDTTTGEDVKYSIREEDPPKNTIKGYKVFFVKDGKLYPPMVANPNGADTPVGVWLNADIGTQAPDSNTGRKQVKSGGKGTQGGSGSLAFRPGWHLGETPLATQFDRINPETGVKELFPENFVWAECEIAADVDYHEEAMSYGYNKNGKFQHSLAGLPKLPENGYYRYRTNPNPDTVPWLITGAMKVNRLLSDAEVNEILAEKGIAPKQRQGGNKTLADLGLSQYEGVKYSDRDSDGNKLTKNQQEFFKESKVRDEDGNLRLVYHGTTEDFTVFDRTKSRANMDIQGSFFSPWDIDAGGYGGNVGAYYLNIKNPASESMGYKALNKFKGQNGAGVKAREYLESLGYDGVNNGDEEYIAFYPEQIKRIDNENPTSDPDIRYSDRDYSYEYLTSKPDIKTTFVDFSNPLNRADTVIEAKKNIIKIGNKNADGSLSVTVKDIGNDVIVTTDSLRHGLQRKLNIISPITTHIGEILENSIRINEMNPKKESADFSYVLIGAATDISNNLYVVRSLVNSFSNEVQSVDVLYAVNAKKETAATKSPRFANNNSLSSTVSNISVSDLLDIVNKHFPEILPESVLRHYGYTKRPDGEVGKYALYSDRNTDSIDNRTLLANALESTAQNDIEKTYISDYKANIEKINAEQEKLTNLRSEIKDMSFSKGARDDAWKQKISKLREEATKTANRINTYDKKLLKLESAKPLKDVLDREKAVAVKKAEAAGRDALNAYRERAAQTQRDLMNRYKERTDRARERRKNTDIRNKIKGLVEEMKTRDFNPKVNRYIPMSLIKPTNELLSIINLDSGRSEKLSEKLSLLKTKYDEIANDPKYSVVYDESISNMIQDLSKSIGDTSIYQMSKEQLEKTYNTLKALMHTIKTAVKAHNIDTEKNIFEISMEMTKETSSVKKESSGTVARWINTQLRPETMFMRLAGFKKNSMWSKVYKMLNDGQTNQMRIEMEANRIFRDVFSDTKYIKSLSGDMVDIGLKDDNGNSVKITRGMMLTIYKAMMNEDNRKHMMVGGITVPDIKKYYKGSDDAYGVGHIVCHGIGSKGLSDLSYKISELIDKKKEIDSNGGNESESKSIKKEIDDLNNQRNEMIKKGNEYMSGINDRIESMLTAGDKSFLNAASVFFDDFSKRELNKTTMELYGFEKAQIENYLPIHTDPNFRQASFEQITKDFNLENSGFMKDRVKASNPIMLEDLAELINSQISKVARYCGLTIPVKDFNKIYGKSSIGFESSLQDTIASKFGHPGKKYIDNLMSDIVGSRTTETTFLDRARGYMAGAVLSINPRVALAQAASLPTAASEIGWKPIIKSSGKFLTSHDYELIAKYTPLLYNRSKGADVELSDIKKMSQVQNRVMRKLNWLMGWIEAMDKRTVGTLWYASQYYVKDKFSDLKDGTDEYYTKVAEVFNGVVERTQPNYSVMQRPDILRNPNAVVKQFTMFMTQRLQNANIIYESASTYNKYRSDYAKGINGVTSADVKEARGTLARSVTSQLVAAAAIVGIKYLTDQLLHNMNAYRDDDEELTKESQSLALLENFIESMIGNVLGGGEMFSVITSILTNQKYYGVTLNGVSSYTDSMENIVKLAQEVLHPDPDMTEKEEESRKRNIKNEILSLSKSVCNMLGIPLGNSLKIFNGIRYHIEDFKNGEGWSFEAGVERSSTQDYGRLYKAIVNGDAKEVGKLKEKYGDDYTKEVRKALRENDPRIQSAAEARYRGDLEEYKRIALEIKGEGNFSQDDIVSAINSAYNKLNTDDGDSDTGDKHKGLFDTSDLETAIEGNNRGMIDDIKEDFIDTKMSNGKSQEDAEKATVTAIRKVIKQSYEDGDISESDARSALTSYGEMDSEEANDKVIAWKFSKENPTVDLSDAGIKVYNDEIRNTGISVELFAKFYNEKSNIRADYDSNGKAISNSRKAKLVEYIDSLPISSSQKDALYLTEYKNLDYDYITW